MSHVKFTLPCLVLLGALAAPPTLASEHGAEIEEPVVVNHGYASEDYYASQDFFSSVALDEQGRGVAVWSTRSQSCEPVAAVTADGGRNWSRHIPLKMSEVEPGNLARHNRPVLATDRQETWIAAWSTNDTLGGTIDPNYDILVVRSVDGGWNWTDPQNVSQPYSSYAIVPQIATDGEGTWGVAWCGSRIGFARSLDNGETWEPWTAIADLDAFNDVALATDGSGNWIVAWTDPEVYYAFSTDNGATWSAREVLAAGNFDYVTLAAHTNGTWVAVWRYYDGDFDLAFSRSVDMRNWSEPQPLNTDADSDGFAEYDEFQNLRVDEHGHWLATWRKSATNNVVGAESYDDGVSWTDPAGMHDDSAHTGGFRASLADDGASNWLMVWNSINTLGGTILNDNDILASPFRLPFSTTCGSDADRDGYGSPGDPFCPLGGATDCVDTALGVAPGAIQRCDGVNNDCDHPLWPSLEGTNEHDDDGDGWSECGGDCNDDDGHSWALPGDVRNLTLELDEQGTAIFRWDPPEETGGDPEALVYDVICSEAPFACRAVGPQFCIERNDGSDTLALDSAIPFENRALFYLVRAENGCPGPGFPGPGGEPPYRLVRVCD